MLHGYQKSHPTEPLCNILKPPPQMVIPGHPQFKPEVEVGGKSYHFQGKGTEIVDFLEDSLDGIKFVSPKNDLRKGESSQPMRFKVSPLKKNYGGGILRQFGELGARIVTLDYLSSYTQFYFLKDDILDIIHKSTSDEPREVVSVDKISVEISPYLNPIQANVVTMNTDKVTASDLAEAVGEALRQGILNKNGHEFQQFSSASNQYIPGAESFNKQNKQENKRQNLHKYRSSRGLK